MNFEEIQDISKLLIDELALNQNWRHRQIFSEFCSRWVSITVFLTTLLLLFYHYIFIISSKFKMSLEPPLFPTVFNQLLFKTVLELATDLVPNIRMGIAKCLSTALARQHVFDSEKQFEETVQILRQLQKDRDSDVREMAICSALPPQDDTEDNQNVTDDNDHRCVEASISNASTVDMNCTFMDEDGGCGKDGDESEESQDSISLYLDTDEKNISECQLN